MEESSRVANDCRTAAELDSQLESAAERAVVAESDELYALALEELTSRKPVSGTFARALAVAGGDEAMTRTLYIKYRVVRLEEEVAAAAQERIRAEERRKDEQAKAEIERKKLAEEEEERTRLEREDSERKTREALLARFPAERSLTLSVMDSVFERYRSGELSEADASALVALYVRNNRIIYAVVIAILALCAALVVLTGVSALGGGD